MNKQLSMLNYKLQNNLSDVGKGFSGIGIDEEATVVGGKFASNFEIDNDLNDELFQRKKAWAELERQGDEVTQNAKSLMRKDPKTTAIDNPLLVDPIKTKSEPNAVYRVPQDVAADRKQ